MLEQDSEKIPPRPSSSASDPRKDMIPAAGDAAMSRSIGGIRPCGERLSTFVCLTTTRRFTARTLLGCGLAC